MLHSSLQQNHFSHKANPQDIKPKLVMYSSVWRMSLTKDVLFFKKKNTVHYCNFISSQSLNHSSHPNPKNKTLLRFPKFPAGRSREKKQRSLFGSLCFVIELLDVLIERTYVILYSEFQNNCAAFLLCFFLFSQIYLLDFANTVTNTSR